MRILYYSPHPHLNLSSKSGYGTHMREMIHAFRKLGHEVMPLIAGGTELPEENSNKSSLPASPIKSFAKRIIPSLLWQSFKDYRLLAYDRKMEGKLVEAIKDFQPDFVYERLNYMQLSGAKVCQKMKLCHFYEVNSPYTQEKVELEGKSLFIRKAFQIEKAQLTKTQKFFPVTHILAKYFIDTHKLGPDAEKACVLANAVNLENFKAEEKRLKELEKKSGIKSGEKIIGFVGSILRWHGVDVLIKAFGRIYEQYPQARLLIVGGGEILDELKDLAKTLKIDDRITFTGNVDHQDVPSYIELMDITIMAKTNWYGSPIKIFEYGALNKAIIAPNTDSVRDVMVDGEDGILIDTGIETLELAMKKLLDDEDLRKGLAQNFHHKVHTQHSWIKNAEAVLAEYEQLISSQKVYS